MMSVLVSELVSVRVPTCPVLAEYSHPTGF
jgi:hypothetical protein